MAVSVWVVESLVAFALRALRDDRMTDFRKDAAVRRLTTRVTDNFGNEVLVAWPVSEDQGDRHGDGQAIAMRFYDELVGDMPQAARVVITTAFEGELS